MPCLQMPASDSVLGNPWGRSSGCDEVRETKEVSLCRLGLGVVGTGCVPLLDMKPEGLLVGGCFANC